MTTSALPSWARGTPWVEHPEGGRHVETFRSARRLGGDQLIGYDLDGAPDRALATVIAFLLLPGETSAWHLVASDELWIHQRGGPLVLGYGGRDRAGPGAADERLLGTDGEPDQGPQLLVPAWVWQTVRPLAGAVMVACVGAPGFDYRDRRLA